ncbi:hypothetical protein [Pauljensenia sp. 20925_1_25]|uniref:hypothetical protein n=1 Tax=Pauljensenia sp. 20925_1_25 TaxID=3003692 RepID=UPI00352D4E8D
MNEHGGRARVVVQLGGQAAQVPAVAGRDEGQDADHRVLGRVQGARQVRGLDPHRGQRRGGQGEPRGLRGQRVGGEEQLDVADELESGQS